MTTQKLEVPLPPGKVRKKGGIQEAAIMSHSKHGSNFIKGHFVSVNYEYVVESIGDKFL
jgi:sporulation protein YlmC with PRC-barrel domain